MNWDAELFRVMPRVLQAADEEAVNAVLADWLKQFPFTPPTAEEALPELEMLDTAPGTQNPMDWISHRAFLGEELCGYLEDLSRTHVSDWTCGYASRGEGVVDFSHEDPRPDFDGTDAGVRLLGAFRFWNAFAWFSPNVDITRTDWDDRFARRHRRYGGGQGPYRLRAGAGAAHRPNRRRPCDAGNPRHGPFAVLRPATGCPAPSCPLTGRWW